MSKKAEPAELKQGLPKLLHNDLSDRRLAARQVSNHAADFVLMLETMASLYRRRPARVSR